MRKTLTALAVLGFVFALSAWAEHPGKTVTLTGEIQCAMCTLQKADAKECQNVLVVTGEHAGEYYLVKNEAAEAYGHVCKGTKPATITGTVTEKDGKTWLTAKEIKAPAAKG
jgi:hypothetical protein